MYENSEIKKDIKQQEILKICYYNKYDPRKITRFQYNSGYY